MSSSTDSEITDNRAISTIAGTDQLIKNLMVCSRERNLIKTCFPKTLKENLTCIHDEKSNGKETYLSEKGKKGRKSV